MSFFQACDVSQATNHSILVLVRITIRIQEFLMERHRANFKNFCGIRALVDVCVLQVPLN